MNSCPHVTVPLSAPAKSYSATGHKLRVIPQRPPQSDMVRFILPPLINLHSAERAVRPETFGSALDTADCENARALLLTEERDLLPVTDPV